MHTLVCHLLRNICMVLAHKLFRKLHRIWGFGGEGVRAAGRFIKKSVFVENGADETNVVNSTALPDGYPALVANGFGCKRSSVK